MTEDLAADAPTDVAGTSVTPGTSPGGIVALGRRSSLFAAGALAGKVVGLFMLPVLTRLLTPSELGNLDVLMTLGNALVTALQIGLDVAALRLYFDQPTPAAQRALLATWFCMSMGISITVAVLMAIASNPMSVALFGDARLQPAVVAIAVVLVGGAAQVVVLTVLRARGQAGRYALLNVGVLVLYAVLATLLLVVWRPDAAAVVTSWAIALTILMLVGTTMLRRDLIARPHLVAARRLLRLGLPMAPAIVGVLVAEFLVRLLLLRLAGSDEVAWFTVGNRFSSVAALALAVLQLAWVPRAYALGVSKLDAVRGRIGREGTWVVAIVATAVLAVAAWARIIVTVAAGGPYAASLPAMGFSLVAVVGAVVFLVMSMPSAVGRRTEDLGLATGLSAIVSVVGTFILAPAWGATGAAASLAMGQLVAVALITMIGCRRQSLGLERGRIAAIGLACCAATLILVTEVPVILRIAAFVATVAVIALSVRLSDGIAVIRGLRHR